VTGPVLIDAARVARLLSWPAAVAAIGDALASGLDPAAQPARTFVPTAAGELILMPAAHGDDVGVKVLSVAPANPVGGAPRIQATYTLMDAATLTPRAVIDGAALTALRTPALSAVVADRLAPARAARLVVFGAGPQAEGHVHALCAVREIRDVVVVSRRTEPALALVERLAEVGIRARAGGREALATADLVATCTTASEPLFDGQRVPDGACVVAVGSHHREARELDDRLLARAAAVVVEDRGTALSEAGDVVHAVRAGVLRAEALVEARTLFLPGALVSRGPGPVVFKSVGQGWQDLVIAAAVYRAHIAGG
jgi:ornithine cyclodeaminase